MDLKEVGCGLGIWMNDVKIGTNSGLVQGP